MSKISVAMFVLLATQVAAEEVYYCQGLELAEWSVPEQKLTQYKPQNFKFSIQQNQLHFGSGGYLDGTKLEITRHIGRFLEANSFLSQAALDLNIGSFNFAHVGYDHITLIAAKCDKF